MATIKEVAKRARVSVGTVSNVMSGAVSVSAALRERVERAARELSYQPNHVARSLKSRKTQTLGMVISDITNPFFPLMVRGAEDAAVKRGYLLNIFNTDDHVEREQTVFAMLRVRRVDGVLAVVAPHSSKPAHLQQMIDAGTPLVCLDRLPPGLQVDAVVVDNAKGAAMCVRHLLSMGHRLIGMISGSSALQTARERVNGYRKALSEAGIPFNPDLLREGDFRLESGYRLAKDLILGNPRPTVLFVANGLMGMGAIKAIQEMGLRCPEDVAIAVFDDVPGADIFRPQLTVVSQPAYEIGYRGAELLIQRITGEIKSTKPVSVVLEPELKVRESTLGVRYTAQPIPNPVAQL
ncbi:MAG TPA: LacI family DNA-binding transcriptional regulator [Bryobacteraceae bacterium]|nr:LacI family DNA-binding transcriptional regulator [Bryobacteraceae bacterium]HOQ46994.1 LacI family DNA-binding transcriptional regulator [Bryobacteraceae bacterium]HPU73079.1 LacI family DNA-binding transcriptional regulator [Bryobacteraceae bacterium]